ncbi:hypothetical protein HMPREF0380_01195 [Eubacterium infirmum F0142]|nr:hypothetical protein HMPREF0380_01195 [Eubacterium infirmum F0142]
MFREQRRKKNIISEESAKELLKGTRRGVLAVIGDMEYPYAVPVNYLYDEENNKIYFHGARSGHKYDSIKTNNKVCFTVFGNETVKDEEWAPYLQSVVVFGRCHLLDYDEASIELLKNFARKYYPNEELITDEIMSSGRAVQMFEIDIEHFSGKEVQEK